MAKQTMRALDVRVADESTPWASMTSLCADVYSVDTGGGVRTVGEGYTGCQDYAHIGAGKRGPETATFNCLFDDDASSAWDTVRAIHETDAGAIWVRWAPEGSTTDAYVWYTSEAICTECPPPSGNVENGEPIAFDFSVTCAVFSTETL